MQNDIQHYADILNESYETEQYARHQVNEWNDTHLPRGRVAHHDTGMAARFWVAVGDDEILNNYSSFVNQSLQLKPLANNSSPSFTTTDITKAKELAKRAILKFPTKFIFVGKDDSSRGLLTQKNHLRASVVDIWDPNYKMWNNGIFESDDIEEADLDEAGIDVLANWEKMKADRDAAEAAKKAEEEASRVTPNEITITGATNDGDKCVITYDIYWSDNNVEKDQKFSIDSNDDYMRKFVMRTIRNHNPLDAAVAMLQQSYDSAVTKPIKWTLLNKKTGVKTSLKAIAAVKDAKKNVRDLPDELDPAKAKAAEIAYKMNKTFGNGNTKYYYK